MDFASVFPRIRWLVNQWEKSIPIASKPSLKDERQALLRKVGPRQNRELAGRA